MINKKNKLLVVATRGIVINSKNEILIVSQDEKKWHLPGGWIEILENIFSSCEREVYEECGLHISAKKIIHISELRKQPCEKYSEYMQKFELYFVCKINGNETLDQNWYDHDNNLIKYRKFISQEEWIENIDIYIPYCIRINVDILKNMPSCYSEIFVC